MSVQSAMAGVDFNSVLEIPLFVLALFYIGVLCKQFGVSPIIGEIITGIILGPNMLNIVPFEDFFRLAGVFGVACGRYNRVRAEVCLGGGRSQLCCDPLTPREPGQ